MKDCAQDEDVTQVYNDDSDKEIRKILKEGLLICGGEGGCIAKFVFSIAVPNPKLDLLSVGHKAFFFFCLPLSTVHCKAQ